MVAYVQAFRRRIWRDPKKRTEGGEKLTAYDAVGEGGVAEDFRLVTRKI